MLNQVLYIFGIFMLSLSSQTLAMKVSKGSCPTNMTAVGNLDMKKYSGIWYPQLTYKLIRKSAPECLIYNISKNAIRKSQVDDMGKLYRRKNSILGMEPENGLYYLQTKTAPEGISVYVLDTDYKAIAIQYSCLEVDGILNLSFATVLTRMRLPDSAVVKKYIILSHNSDLDVEAMIQIRQDACPDDPKFSIHKEDKEGKEVKEDKKEKE